MSRAVNERRLPGFFSTASSSAIWRTRDSEIPSALATCDTPKRPVCIEHPDYYNGPCSILFRINLEKA